MTRIAVIDYGSGNLASVTRALASLGATFVVTSDPAEIRAADALILPGQGAFRDCMTNLEGRGLDAAIRASLDADKPYLGICLGLQILFDRSDEFGTTAGLGFLPGRVRRFEGPWFEGRPPELKVPHMGWTKIDKRAAHPVFDGIESGAYFYFVHSYFCEADEAGDIVASATHGLTYTAAAARGRVVGVQFHPEKSQAAGRRLLANFLQFVSGDSRVFHSGD